jgi:ribosomal protein L24E
VFKEVCEQALNLLRNDDRIRWTTFYRISADDLLARYAPSG